MHIITLMYPSGGAQKYATERAEAENSSIFYGWKRNIAPLSDVSQTVRLFFLLLKQKPEKLVLHSTKAGIYGTVVGALLRIPIQYVIHGWASENKWYGILERFLTHWRQEIVVLGEHGKRVALRFGIPKEKIRIEIPPVPPVAFLSKEEAILKLGGEPTFKRKRIGCIANFFPTKGVDLLIEAHKALYENDPSAPILYLIGEGPEEEKLKKLADISSIRFSGYKKNAAQYAKAFDVLVFPSRKEGLPYAIRECLPSGVPIIATDVGEVSSLPVEELVSPTIAGIFFALKAYL